MLKRRLAFIKTGHFSHINAALRAELGERFPALEVEEIDIWQDVLGAHPTARLIGLFQALFHYSRRLFADRHTVSHTLLRTPHLFRKLRELLAEHLLKGGKKYAFTFQTQSIFNASVAGIPHFVFTDHTHLANLRYTAFRKELLYPEPWGSLEKEIYADARHIFVMGENVRTSLCEDYGVAPAQVTTVYGGSNVDASPVSLENDDYSNRTVVFVGIDWERKSGPALVRAFEKLLLKMPDARLIVVGCRPQLGKPWCEEIGKVSREEVKRHLVRGSVFCMPSLIEPFGIAVIEAFAHHLPVVTSSVGAMPTLVRDGETGLLVPPNDDEALANALHSLLSAPARCRACGNAGWADFNSRYSWNAVGKRLHDVISAELGEQFEK